MRIRCSVAVVGEWPDDLLPQLSVLHKQALAAVERVCADVGLDPVEGRCWIEQLPDPAGGVCAHCGAQVPASARPGGRQRRFCSEACRLAAYRRRRAGLEESTPRTNPREGGRFPLAVRVRLDQLREVVYPLGDRGGASMHVPRSDQQWASMRALAGELSEVIDDRGLAAAAPAGAGLVRQARQLLELHDAETSRRE